MNMVSVTASRLVKNVEPFNVISQLIGRQFSGCLRIMAGEEFWSIYFEQGELVYGTTSVDAFQRLEHYLHQIGQHSLENTSDSSREHVPSLLTATRVQERLSYEKRKSPDALPSPDYQALCWLVDQKYLTYPQANNLIEVITSDAITSLLCLKSGTCKVFKAHQKNLIRKLCKLNTRLLVDRCRKQARWQRHENTVEQLNQQTHKDLSTSSQNSDPHRIEPSQASKNYRSLLNSSVTGRISNNRSSSGKQKYKIGCIDDSPAVLNSLRSCLDDKQFSVFTVSNPVKALMTIIRHKPDLILLDVMMPELDGYELCSLLRKHPDFKGIPIIIVTSNTGLVDRAKAKVVRASGYLTKPFTKEELLKVIRKHLHISSAA